MKESFYRTAMLLGEVAENILAEAVIVIFGIGGVGGHCADALARCGVGKMIIIDNAKVKSSNLNRQLCARYDTIGMDKVYSMQQHLVSVSDCTVEAVNAFALPENIASLIPKNASLVIDAVDTVTAKLAIIEHARLLGIPVLSSMGAGNRLDPTAVRIADIYSTSIDPLSRIMRRELRKRNIKNLTVAYSIEEPHTPVIPTPDPDMKPNAPASVPFVPAAFGLALAAEAVKILLQ